MRRFSTAVVFVASSASVGPWAAAARSQTGAAAGARIVVDKPQVRVYRTADGSRRGITHGPAVVVLVEDSAGGKAGSARWVEDAAAPPVAAMRGTVVIVQPRDGNAAPVAAAGSQPGEATFSGMSFRPMFENNRVSVIRARMEVGAREGEHTHGSDTVVIHLSGGEIEDTADGRTVMNRWKRGDVEFEALGSSHSARNAAGPVDVVLVTMKPR